jgi:hypothetical protein
VAQLTEAPYRMKGYRTLPLGDYESFRFIPPHFVKPIEGCNISLLDPFASLGWQTLKGRAIALSFPRFVSFHFVGGRLVTITKLFSYPGRTPSFCRSLNSPCLPVTSNVNLLFEIIGGCFQ